MIFVDTSFWIALRNRRDAHHSDAVALLRTHADRRLLTTNHVRGETWTYLHRRAGHRAAVEFLNALERSPRLRLLVVDEPLEVEALRWLRQYDKRESDFRRDEFRRHAFTHHP